VRRLALALCLLALLCPAAAATTLRELQQQGHLEVRSEIQASDPLVPGQRARLILEISVDTWFTGGTRIALPEVPGLVLLQTEQFASNASATRNGQTWVVQRWAIDVYPQRPGRFTIPPLRLRLQVNGGGAGDVAGELFSPPANLQATLPAALEPLESWVAAPAFSVTQRFDRDLEGLQVGDAFERRIEFEAADVMAMMLPTVAARDIEGLAAYPAPPVLEDSNNRGQMRAARSRSISYVMQAPGDYELPALRFAWWDTRDATLREVELPAIRFSVGAVAARTGAHATPRVDGRAAITALAAALVVALVLRLATRYLPLSRMLAATRAAAHWLAALRRPALPPRLNPGNRNAE